MAKTVGLIGLGCAKNRVDGEVMLGLLQQAGYEVVANPEQADTIIIHTCGFIGAAKEESIDTILGRRVAQTGQTSGGHRLPGTTLCPGFAPRNPEIDAFMGTADCIPHRRGVRHRDCRPSTRRRSRRQPVEPKVWLGDPPYLYDADTRACCCRRRAIMPT